MKIQFKHLALISASLFVTANAQAAAAEHEGLRLMKDANCAKCHQAKGYHPEKTPDYPALVKRVTACNNNFNSGWFDDDIETVSDYLNQTYYHYKKPSTK